MRASRAIRSAAWVVLAAGVAAPLLRRRVRLPPPVIIGTAAAAPMALCVVMRRSRVRDVTVCCLQMWAYLAAYEMPNDDPEALLARVHLRYPIAVDRAIGLGTLPTLRLQRRFADPEVFSRLEKTLAWTHGAWFAVPHAVVAYVIVFHRDRVPRAAAMTYAVFDIGVAFYWLVPTAPPWYAAREGYIDDGREPVMRRMLTEYGAQFFRDRWGAVYDALAGNPLAAMPSLHFATSVNAALVLSEIGPIQGALGWTYALTLGTALVYLGEHYVIDLLAGAALTSAVWRAAPAATPALERCSRALRALEARAAS